MVEARTRRAWAEVNLDAIRHNVATLRALTEPAQLCAVVKADAYGHGAVPVAHAALDAGATWLAVAVVDEGVQLRDAGIDAPVLLLSEPPLAAIEAAVERHLTPTVYTDGGVAAVAAAAARCRRRVAVHLKVDTGMRRVGAAVGDATRLAAAIVEDAGLLLEGLWTHLAVADDPASDGETARQLACFEEVRDGLAGAGIVPPLLHVANSAGAIAHASSRYDLVRCGIALYGYPPSPALAPLVELSPALSLKAEVSFVKPVDAGQRLSYGHTYAPRERCTIATVPLGYADGVRRALSSTGGHVLVHGRRLPIAGTVTMDQFLVDCGGGAAVAAGDEVVLLGRQGATAISAEDWAERLGTIPYEVLCGIGARVPRVYRGAGAGSGDAVQEDLRLT